MATDGVKIIDSDTAHDTYWNIMDLYDNGATAETIRMQIPFPQTDYYDDFDYEIFTTVYALAMWEIGFIKEDIVCEVKKVIDKGACVKIWTEEFDAKSGKQRQKELDKLWNKITSENVKVRKRKKYKLIDKFLFDINDVLVFQLSEKYFHVTILLNVTQYRGECTYRFGKILCKSQSLPTLEQIKNSKIIGRKIPSGFGMDMTNILAMGFEELHKQGGIGEVLKREAERTGSFEIGMSMIGIDHRELINFTDKFTKIGNLNLKEVCKQMGSLGVASTFEELTSQFKDFDYHLKVFQEGTFDIKDMLNE